MVFDAFRRVFKNANEFDSDNLEPISNQKATSSRIGWASELRSISMNDERPLKDICTSQKQSFTHQLGK